MINKSISLICNSENSKYDIFFDMLKKNLPQLRFYLNENYFINDMKNHTSKSPQKDSDFFILFVEYSHLDDTYTYLNSAYSNQDYILIAFDNSFPDSLNEYDNLFEFINVNNHKMDLFFKKLMNEINIKNKILSLKYELKEFYEIGKSLSSQKDTVKLLDMIVTSSINLTSSDAGTIYLVIDKNTFNWTSIKGNQYDDKILKFIIAKNMSLDINLETYTSPITEESLFGYSVVTGKAIRVDDAYNISPKSKYKHNDSFDNYTGYVTKSILTIPMKDHENNISGVIQLLNKKKNKHEKLIFSDKSYLDNIITYNRSDELIMNSLAGQAAVALENNTLYKNMKNLLGNYKEQNIELEKLSQKILISHEEERKRIAREIHDGPAQSVVNLSLKVDLIKKYFKNSMFEKGMEELDNINSSIKSTSKEIRTILYDLKPSYLEEGLVTALQNRLTIFEENTGIKVDFKINGSSHHVEYYLASNIYRMVQESLSNISKHAKAQNVTVDFSVYDDKVLVSITDDGIGFNVKEQIKNPEKIQSGFGLNGLKERAELVKGKVSIDSEVKKGTCVTIYVPLK
ncbi:GAF domain-containing sensor histidine kinase [Herbivorax sp. ANBcel31]|uniref:GAF domain-containing sensor histidine kinase n=1 Tax=Herbivorax sp. ANBcel31 TaxID=3069754 RepID=UPI0027B52125|nr:GAF domain-containing sensor histidine kinase [Herbivorax sp. ANBcel31]MDQ2085389.1 GAF domain-containing sensor histidine kinase [Herbivorax sp. ANBcel31]